MLQTVEDIEYLNDGLISMDQEVIKNEDADRQVHMSFHHYFPDYIGNVAETKDVILGQGV